MLWRIWQVLFIGFLAFLDLKVGAQTSNPGSSHPGCYDRCRFLQLDYDPTRMSELCDKTTSLGGLFVDNFQSCADCVRKNDGLSSFFDTVDAQDAMDMVNLCQSLFPTNHDEIVSAMSVISKHAGLVGELVTEQKTTFTTPTTSAALTTTTADASTTSDAETEVRSSSSGRITPEKTDSNSEDRSWIAGAVVGPLIAAALVIAAFVVLRRRKQRQTAEIAVDEKRENIGFVEKSELPGEGNARHELEEQNAVETMATPAPQELSSNPVAELPANERG